MYCKKHQDDPLIKTSCNLTKCKSCYDSHRAFDNCKKCKESCKICKETHYNKIKFYCSHAGCEKCAGNKYCLKCLLETDKYNSSLIEIPEECCICHRKTSRIKLFCGLYICLECKLEISMKISIILALIV